MQASSSLFWEVFRDHDAGNLLLGQAEREVLERELEIDRLRRTLAVLETQTLERIELSRPSPFSFPLLVERMRERLSTEKLSQRVAKLLAELERAAEPKR